MNDNNIKDRKKRIFEYMVFQLALIGRENRSQNLDLSKLRLQKILFLLAAKKATGEDPALLTVFDKFYALPYGPVELDIYDSMNANGFDCIRFEGNNCCNFEDLAPDDFSSLSQEDKQSVDDLIFDLKDRIVDYLTMPVFELVEITHRWTVWQVAISLANMFGGRSAPMSTQEICKSEVKVYSM